MFHSHTLRFSTVFLKREYVFHELGHLASPKNIGLDMVLFWKQYTCVHTYLKIMRFSDF